MKYDNYEEYLLDMKQIASYLLKKMKTEHGLMQEERKHIRHLRSELRRRTTIARYWELLRQEKSEAGRRFLLFIFMYLIVLFQQQARDEKSVRELHQYLASLREHENAQGFSQGIWKMRNRKTNVIFDEAKPAV